MDRAFAYKNEKDILNRSSSGGAFLGIVNSFLKLGRGTSWSVYGARFDKDFNVIHSRATCLEECYAFCGSKYVQSNLGTTLSQAVEDLRNGMFVLFTGTPCQMAAVKAYSEKNNVSADNLFTVDIACHGTPQPKFWNEWVQYIEKKNNARLMRFSFRYKAKGWKGYPILAEFSNGKKYENAYETSSYMALFRKGLLMRKSCFNCKYPGHFQSDITIADFWGVQLCMPDIPVDGGVSLMLSHSEKGIQIVNNMNPNPVETLTTDYLKYNHNLVNGTEKPKLYDVFWDDYKNQGVEYILCKYGGDNFKGKIKFYVKTFLRDSGLLAMAKKVLKKA